MKQILIIFIATLTITACTSRSGRRVSVPAEETPVVQPIEKKEVTESEKTVNQDFAFSVKEVKVRPMQINQNDTYGEGEEPAVSLEYTFYFVDSTGNTKEWCVYEVYTKKASSDANEATWRNRTIEDFNKAKKLYEEITKIPEGRVYVEGSGLFVKRIYKELDLTSKKIGNATVVEDPMVLLWSEYQ